MRNPLDMLGPSDFAEEPGLSREALVVNIHYLHDSGLAELMVGYNPQSFSAVRITARGIDLVENRYEFNRRFPAQPLDADFAMSEAVRLAEALEEEIDLAPLDWDTRQGLRQDVGFLRQELARPAELLRKPAVEAVVSWIEAALAGTEETLPSLAAFKRAFAQWRP